MNEPSARIWNATLYLRLSRDDGDKEESNSIVGQRNLIRDYLTRHPELKEVSVKTDDGYSGSTFDRPAFQEMMEDIKVGKTNCVIVKDLSRFGRNYLDAGEYIEKIFPFMGVRFIAINDNFDSENKRSGSDSLMVPFKNLINEAYCRDISIKIRSSLEVKRKQGEYLSSFAVYGYKKDPQDKHRLMIDEYAADVVRRIFRLKIEGVSPGNIAETLNHEGVLSPLEYKKSQGMKYTTGFKSSKQATWTAASIIRLLKNPIYTGTLIQGRETTPSYKVHKRVQRPEDSWVVVQNSHEAIVSQSDFDRVQRVLAMDTRTGTNDSVVLLLSGLVYCGDCGAPMTRKTVPAGGKKYSYYVCSENKANKKTCSSHSIRDKDLEEIVLLTTQQYIGAVIEMQEVLDSIDDNALCSVEAKRIQRQVEQKKTELERLNRLMMSLYENLTESILEKDEYLRLKKGYSSRIAEAQSQLDDLQEQLTNIGEHKSAALSWMDEFRRHRNITALDRETVISLIDRVLVYENHRVEVAFQWHDEFQWQSELLRRNELREAV